MLKAVEQTKKSMKNILEASNSWKFTLEQLPNTMLNKQCLKVIISFSPKKKESEYRPTLSPLLEFDII